jgi:acyl-CoA synthetase (AMP-forming)/AMP-acid ligase II
LLSFLLERTDEEAVAFLRPGGEGMTYGSLAMAVRALSDALIAQVGELRHRALGIAVEDQAGFLVAALAGFALEAVIVPLDARAGQAGVIAQAQRARVVGIVQGNRETDALEVVPVDSSRRELDARAALILFTSGSSGAPKAAVLSKAGLQANIDAILGYLPVRPESRTPIVLPLAYSYALVGQAFVTLRAGGALVGLGELAYPAEQLQAMERLGCDGLSSVPTALRVLAEVAAELPAGERPRLRYVASAGGPLDRATIDRVRAAFPEARLYNQYGLTEASPRVTAISEREPQFLQGSVGKPIAGTTVRAVDGELVVSGPSVMLGYLDDPAETQRAIGPDGLHTGDRGRVDADGYVYVDGRADGVVKIGGERVSAEEVAEVLRAAPGVFEAGVVAIPDDRLGARLVAFVIGGEKAALQAWLRDRLPPAKRPRLEQVTELPRTANGKLDLAALKAQAERE